MQQKRKTEIAGCLGEIFMLTSSHIYSLSFHTGHLIITSNFFPVCGWFPGPLFSCFCHSVQFSSPAMSNSLRPHRLQHARPPCPSPTPRVYSNSCPLSWWCHPTISSSVIPFSSCFQSFPTSGSFLVSQFFSLGGQSIGISASASVLPMNIQNWFL